MRARSAGQQPGRTEGTARLRARGAPNARGAPSEARERVADAGGGAGAGAASAGAACRAAPRPPRFATAAAARFWRRLVFEAPAADDHIEHRCHMFEFFAGHAGMAAAFADRGCDATAIDWGANRHLPMIPVTPVDLSEAPGQRVAFDLLEVAPVHFVWLAPPCGTFSRARDKALPEAARMAGIPPVPVLRTDAFVEGVPGLPAELRARVAAANTLVNFTKDVALWCLQRGVAFAIENPATSRMWRMPALAGLARRPGVFTVQFHHCMFGGRRPKHTQLLTR